MSIQHNYSFDYRNLYICIIHPKFYHFYFKSLFFIRTIRGTLNEKN